jgi:hypothetical protein
MKKILALVLSLMMVLVAVSAMAADSPDPTKKQNAAVEVVEEAQAAVPAAAAPAAAPAAVNKAADNAEDEETLTLKILETNSDAVQAIIDQFAAANNNGDVLSVLPDDVKAKIPEGLTNINEIVTAQFEGDTTKVSGTVILKITFLSEYEEGQDVAVLFGKLTATDVEWTVAEGKTVKEDDVVKVQVSIPAELVKSLGNEQFALAVVSK